MKEWNKKGRREGEMKDWEKEINKGCENGKRKEGKG